MGDACRRVMNIMLALCTHFLFAQTASLTLNIDPFPSLSVILRVWLEPPLLLLTNRASSSRTNPLIQHRHREK